MKITDVLTGAPLYESKEDPIVRMEEFLASFPKEHRPGYHVSQLHSLCPVREALRKRQEAEGVVEMIDPESWFNYRIGHAYHDIVQNELLGPVGALYGNWRCSHCEDRHPDFGPMPKGRPDCCTLKSTWEYVEPAVFDEEYDIVGNCDGLVGFSLDELDVLEIKSLNGMKFFKTTEAFAEHEFQAQVYAYLLKENKKYPIGNIRKIIIPYIGKGPHTNQGRIKRYHVNLSEVPYQKSVEKIKRIREIEACDGIPSESDRICVHPKDDTAKYCPVAQECFFGNVLRRTP